LNSEPIRVVLVDDHTLFREGLSELITHDGQITVVAEGACGEDAVRLAVLHRPDVVVLDVEMPGQPARRTVTQLRQSAPGSRIVILTMHEDPAIVRELLDCGATAYLVKTVARHELIAAIRATARTQSDTVMISVSRRTLHGLEGRASDQQLSTRETEVLRLVAGARSNAQVASVLFITEGTVKRHLTNVYAKLGAVSRLDAVRKATTAGLLRGLEAD